MSGLIVKRARNNRGCPIAAARISAARWEGCSVGNTLVAVSIALASMFTLSGCGEPGAPQPPSLNLPQPVRALTAQRIGNTVHLAWSTSDRTTDHAPVTGTVRTHICRIEGTGPCELVDDLPLKLGSPSQFDDTLPTDALQGPPQLLTYYVELLNHGGKSAGRSNPAYAASGQAAPELSALSATVRREGVELRWVPTDWPVAEGAARVVRITRLDETPPAKPTAQSPGNALLAKTPLPPLQTLEVAASENRRAGSALDKTAQFGQSYRYQAQCVEKLMLDGHAIEIAGAVSEPATVLTLDKFPPGVPQQVASAADPATHAIDLSWTADSEPDLAGYAVYRQNAVGQGREMPVRISGVTPLPVPAFHDTDVSPGSTYAYTVTAIDQSGNESAPSDEVDETLPLPR